MSGAAGLLVLERSLLLREGMSTYTPHRAAAMAAVLLSPLFTGCLNETPTAPRVLSPEGSEVAIAMSTPSPSAYECVGKVVAYDVDKESYLAEQSAQRELRNEAAKMGASLVTVDSTSGQRVFLQDRVKVTLRGRAFRPRS